MLRTAKFTDQGYQLKDPTHSADFNVKLDLSSIPLQIVWPPSLAVEAEHNEQNQAIVINIDILMVKFTYGAFLLKRIKV